MEEIDYPLPRSLGNNFQKKALAGKLGDDISVGLFN
jgi:hypothetical protein